MNQDTNTNDMKTLEEFAPLTFRFYREAIRVLQEAGVPFLVGGAYALAHYTGITRHTKDFDIFLREADVQRALEAFADAGYHGEVVFSHWLAKVYNAEDFVDIIFNSGNGLCRVDDEWFAHAPRGRVLGSDQLLMPAEEMIWQKAFIMERERFDGADVNHLLRARGNRLDWPRLLARFGDNWPVLLAHLILYRFVYPGQSDRIPADVIDQLVGRLNTQTTLAHATEVCRGTFLSRTQYLADTEQWGNTDARLAPAGTMTEDQVETWTNAGR